MSDPNPEEDGQDRFARLYSAHHLDLLRYVLTLIPNLPQAQDVVQETARVLWRKAAEYDPERPFLPWARKVAWLEVLKHRRGMARRREFFSEAILEKLADERAEQEDALRPRREALDACLERLDEESRQLLRERFGEGLSLVNIAARQGRSPNALYLVMHRIRRRLLECVERVTSREAAG